MTDDEGEREQRAIPFGPVPYCILDESGTIRELSTSAADLLRRDARTLRGKPLHRFAMAEERRGVLEHVRLCIAEQAPRSLTASFHSRSRPAVVLKLLSRPLPSSVIGFAGCYTGLIDVTEEKRDEEQLRVAVRMREDFLAVVAHDLRGPLAAIAMSADLLERQPAPELHRREVDRIRRAATRMDRLIGDLLDLSSMDAGHLAMEPGLHDVEDLIVAALEIASPLAAAKGLSLSAQVERAGQQAWCDRERVIQALLNLLTNAVKFTAAGSISVRAKRCGDEVQLVVHDTGTGMSRTQIDHIFDPYWQVTARSGDGTGLGLSIVKGIIQLHGGRTWVESSVGRGSSFSFTLPAFAPGASPPVEAKAPARRPTLASGTSRPDGTRPLVMIVEDESSVRESISAALLDEGYDVIALPHGRAALDYLQEARVLPVLILLDLVMPVMDGWEFLRQASRAPGLSRVPIVLVSAQADSQSLASAHLAGYINKPVRLANLCEVVGNCAAVA